MIGEMKTEEVQRELVRLKERAHLALSNYITSTGDKPEEELITYMNRAKAFDQLRFLQDYTDQEKFNRTLADRMLRQAEILLEKFPE